MIGTVAGAYLSASKLRPSVRRISARMSLLFCLIGKIDRLFDICKWSFNYKRRINVVQQSNETHGIALFVFKNQYLHRDCFFMMGKLTE